MFFCRSTMSSVCIWCTDLAYCKWQDLILLVSLSLRLKKMASLTWGLLFCYVHVLLKLNSYMLRMGRRRQGEFVPEEKNQTHFKTRDVPLLVCTFICLWGRCPNTTLFISELLPTHRLNWYHLQRNAWFFFRFFFLPLLLYHQPVYHAL